MRVRLDVRYDGTDFHGWAAQPRVRTVAGELTEALTTLLREAPRNLTVAGRTDAGVHARGQVVHLDLDPQRWAALPGRSGAAPAQALLTRLAAVLPADVVVTHAQPVGEDFDARFGALWRRYRYRLADRPGTRDPVRRRDVVWHRRELDVPAMHESVQPLLGEHDFLPFCIPREKASTVRTMLGLGWSRDPAGLVLLDLRADALCHHMVRMIVGASLAVGEGRQGTGWPAQLLAAGVRDCRVTVAAPHGLTLEEVAYPPAEELAAQARRARRFRAR